MSGEVRQTCAARSASAASRAAVYFASCWRTASSAALVSPALSLHAAQDSERIAKHTPPARKRAAALPIGFLAVDNPGNAKLIRDHAETMGPECFLNRHTDGSSFRQLGKQALRIVSRRVQRDREASGRLIRSWSRIGSLNPGIAHRQRGVINLAAPLRRRVLGHRRIAPG